MAGCGLCGKGIWALTQHQTWRKVKPKLDSVFEHILKNREKWGREMGKKLQHKRTNEFKFERKKCWIFTFPLVFSQLAGSLTNPASNNLMFDHVKFFLFSFRRLSSFSRIHRAERYNNNNEASSVAASIRMNCSTMTTIGTVRNNNKEW